MRRLHPLKWFVFAAAGREEKRPDFRNGLNEPSRHLANWDVVTLAFLSAGIGSVSEIHAKFSKNMSKDEIRAWARQSSPRTSSVIRG